MSVGGEGVGVFPGRCVSAQEGICPGGVSAMGGVCPGGVCPVGVSTQWEGVCLVGGGVCPRGCLSRGRVCLLERGVHHPPRTEFLTHAGENLTCPQKLKGCQKLKS